MKNVKPQIEDIAGEVLSGDALKNALDFVAYLRENKLNPIWSATNVWKASSKTFNVCFIRLHGAAPYHGLAEGEWNISPFIGEYEASLLSDENKEIAWANKKDCPSCGQCALKLDTVFGKKYDYVCEGAIRFRNPDTDAIECAKRIVELRRNEIKAGKARKHQYIAAKDRI